VVDAGAAERVRAGRRAGRRLRQEALVAHHVPGGAGRRGREEDPVTDRPDPDAVLADALDQLAAGIRRAASVGSDDYTLTPPADDDTPPERTPA
jgi:hypothetical protein